jgi:hypothetical protein
MTIHFGVFAHLLHIWGMPETKTITSTCCFLLPVACSLSTKWIPKPNHRQLKLVAGFTTHCGPYKQKTLYLLESPHKAGRYASPSPSTPHASRRLSLSNLTENPSCQAIIAA